MCEASLTIAICLEKAQSSSIGSKAHDLELDIFNGCLHARANNIHLKRFIERAFSCILPTRTGVICRHADPKTRCPPILVLGILRILDAE